MGGFFGGVGWANQCARASALRLLVSKKAHSLPCMEKIQRFNRLWAAYHVGMEAVRGAQWHGHHSRPRSWAMGSVPRPRAVPRRRALPISSMPAGSICRSQSRRHLSEAARATSLDAGAEPRHTQHTQISLTRTLLPVPGCWSSRLVLGTVRQPLLLVVNRRSSTVCLCGVAVAGRC